MDGRLRYAGRAAGYCRIRSKTMEASNTFPRVDADVAESIADLMRRSRAAQTDYAGMGQAAMDDAVAAVGWAIMEPSRNRQLAELAVRDTGLGNVEDKILKNHRKTLDRKSTRLNSSH